MWRWKAALSSRKTLTLQVSTQPSPTMDEIDREVKWCIEIDIEVLKAKGIEPEEAIKLLHSRICQGIAQTFITLQHEETNFWDCR